MDGAAGWNHGESRVPFRHDSLKGGEEGKEAVASPSDGEGSVPTHRG